MGPMMAMVMGSMYRSLHEDTFVPSGCLLYIYINYIYIYKLYICIYKLYIYIYISSIYIFIYCLFLSLSLPIAIIHIAIIQIIEAPVSQPLL